MRTPMLILAVLMSTVLLGAGADLGRAADSETPSEPTAMNVRAAVQRSLPYIEEVATTWMRERKCNTCHVVTFLLWSHNRAAASGLVVDRKKLAEWTKWSLDDSLAVRQWYGIRLRTLEGLKADGLPAEQLAKLKPSGKNYTTDKDFLAALEKILGRAEVERHQESLLRRGALPNNGGGPDTLAQLLLGQPAAGTDHEAKESYAAVRSLLLEHQEPDGSWHAQGQLPGLKWAGEPEMHEATTMWSLLAISQESSADPGLVRSRQLAVESLKKAAPRATLQTLALRVIVAAKFGAPTEKEALLKELLGRQKADGGWSWMKDSSGSDAFATGQALYALGFVGQNGQETAVRRAWEFLLQSQEKDGRWEVPQEAINRGPRKLNVYTYWGTAWAVIGMLQSLPAGPDSR